MPNGHGGVVRWGAPVFWGVLFALFLLNGARTGATWTRWAGTGAAALFAWRLSWHFWLYPLMEYGGAYASEEGLQAGRTLHRITTAVLVPLCGGLAWWLWP